MSTTKSILYIDGPQRITCGAAGTFQRDVPRTIDADLANRLLAKTSIKFTELPAPKPAKKKED